MNARILRHPSGSGWLVFFPNKTWYFGPPRIPLSKSEMANKLRVWALLTEEATTMEEVQRLCQEAQDEIRGWPFPDWASKDLDWFLGKVASFGKPSP